MQKRLPRTFAELREHGLLSADEASWLHEHYRLSGTDLLVQAGSDDVVALAFERSENGPWLLLTEDGDVVEASGSRARRDLAEAPDEVK